MREIKFRAWNKQLKIMRNVEYIYFENRELRIYYDEDDYTPTLDIVRNFDGFEIMQSTGLKDKNGVEIFYGDIVENTSQIVYLGSRFEVTWNKNYSACQLKNNGLIANIPLTQDWMSYEVIGNIYENKELLEGKK